MLIDANVLLYAVDTESPFHDRARAWLEGALNGDRRVGVPWASLNAFLRISTNARAMRDPLTPADSWAIVESWLDAPTVWIPEPGPGHRAIFGRLIRDLDLRGNLVSDGFLASICLEQGLQMVSADSDFARFPDMRWLNPLIG